MDRFNQGLRKKDEGNRTLNLEAAFACGSLQCITRTSSCGLLLLFVCSERVSHLLRLSKVPIPAAPNNCKLLHSFRDLLGRKRMEPYASSSLKRPLVPPTGYNHSAALLNGHVHRSCATMVVDYLFSSPALARSFANHAASAFPSTTDEF